MRTVVALLALVACRSPLSRSACPAATDEPEPPSCTAAARLADRCERGELAACSAGARGLAASALRSDRERAVHLHELACERNTAEGCAALARDLASGKYVTRDVVRAGVIRTALCDRGVAGACYELALQYLGGEGVAKDEARGERLLVGACEARSAEACEHRAGSEHPEMFAPAFEIYVAACRAGDAAACRSARWMARCGRLPSDVLREAWAATSLATLTGCAAGDPAACAAVATLSEPDRGDFDDPDTSPAHQASQGYRTRACELGDAPSCAVLANRRLGSPYGRQPDLPGGRALFERACQLGDATSCGRASALVEDLAARRALLLRGCELADGDACEKAIEMLRMGTGGPVDRAGMRRLENQLCSQGSSRHCLSQGHEAQERGDLAAARRYSLRACSDQGDLVGCRVHARLLRDACHGGDTTSCQELDRFFAGLPAGKRGLAAFECCRDRPEMAVSPTVQLAVFADALLNDASAVRAFVHPERGMKIHTQRSWKRGVEEHHLRIRAPSLDVEAVLNVVSVFALIDAIECPETFQRDRATCAIHSDGFRGRYELRRDGERVYVVEIDERG